MCALDGTVEKTRKVYGRAVSKIPLEDGLAQAKPLQGKALFAVCRFDVPNQPKRAATDDAGLVRFDPLRLGKASRGRFEDGLSRPISHLSYNWFRVRLGKAGQDFRQRR